MENLVSKEDLFYIEASAKSRENIDEIFSVLMYLMIERENEQEASPDASTLLASLRRTLSDGETIEKSLIAERQRSPRHEALDPGVIVLEEMNARDKNVGNDTKGVTSKEDGSKNNKKTLVLFGVMKYPSLTKSMNILKLVVPCILLDPR